MQALLCSILVTLLELRIVVVKHAGRQRILGMSCGKPGTKTCSTCIVVMQGTKAGFESNFTAQDVEKAVDVLYGAGKQTVAVNLYPAFAKITTRGGMCLTPVHLVHPCAHV
jgi:hypothetical protein